VLWLKSRNSEVWLERRTTYTRSCAVMSMVRVARALARRPSCPALHALPALACSGLQWPAMWCLTARSARCAHGVCCHACLCRAGSLLPERNNSERSPSHRGPPSHRVCMGRVLMRGRPRGGRWATCWAWATGTPAT